MRLQKAAEDELRRAKELAEDAAATKASFLATMSHEIRTPLNGVIGTATLLSDTHLDDTQQQYVTTLKRSAEVLLSLINDILDFSKMDAGKVQLESIPFSLGVLLHDLDSMFHDQFEQKSLKAYYQLDPQLPQWLLGDEHRLRQVMINLIGNALKFTEQGGVFVRVQQLEQYDQHQSLIRFSVKDTGIGISPAAQARLFEAFTQADSSTTRQFGGTGLGLTISKKIIELMQGHLQVTSTEGKGSQFFFDIRLTQTDCPVTQAPSAAPISQADPHDKYLLLVEDNKINQLVAGKFLQKFGYQFDIAENGAQALERMETKTYDAILMDCQMPVLDGFEATKQIRLLEQTSQRHVPIIGLTANALEGDREKCLACGMDDFTTKPIKIDELEAKLKHWCFSNPTD
jgi:CheY-like chemotaxis protein/nitrogen-specific signal transduction histidine kinase